MTDSFRAFHFLSLRLPAPAMRTTVRTISAEHRHGEPLPLWLIADRQYVHVLQLFFIRIKYAQLVPDQINVDFSAGEQEPAPGWPELRGVFFRSEEHTSEL